MNGDREAEPRGEALVSFATKDLGQKTVREDQIISFPWGLPGFVEWHRYALLQCPHLSPFLCLQCVEKPDLAFITVDPVKVVPEYRLSPLNNGVLKDLAAENVNELRVLVILAIPPGQPQEMTANLLAPILINVRRNLGKQVVLEASQYSHRHRVFSS